jgi:tetratricopeptide (TPR) repeat protein
MFNSALQQSPSELAIRYAKTTNTIGNQDVMRKDLSIVEESKIKANIAFSAQNYQTSIQEYSKLVMLRKADYTDHFYLGVSYLKSEFPDTKKAMEHLLIAQNNTHFNQEIDWYLALCYTLNKEYKQAEVFLNKIIQNKSFKNKEASILLNTMNDFK